MGQSSTNSPRRILPPPPGTGLPVSPVMLVLLCLAGAVMVALVTALVVTKMNTPTEGDGAATVIITSATPEATGETSPEPDSNPDATAEVATAEAAPTELPTETPAPTPTTVPSPTPLPPDNLVIAVDEDTDIVYVGSSTALHLTLYALEIDPSVTTLKVTADYGQLAFPNSDIRSNECSSGLLLLAPEQVDTAFSDGVSELLLCVPPTGTPSSTVTITAQGIASDGTALQSGSTTLKVRRDSLKVDSSPIATALEPDKPLCPLPEKIIIDGTEYKNPLITKFEMILTSTNDKTGAPRSYSTTFRNNETAMGLLPTVIPAENQDPAATAEPALPPLSGWLFVYRSSDCAAVVAGLTLAGFNINPVLELDTPYIGYYVLPAEAKDQGFVYPHLIVEASTSAPAFGQEITFEPVVLNTGGQISVQAATTDTTRRGWFNAGDTLVITGQKNVEDKLWWRVDFNGQEGWITGNSLLIIGDISQTPVV